MICRSELDSIAALLADAAHLHPGEVAELASQLLAELERTRMREAFIRAEHADLVAAAQATLAGGRASRHRPPCLVFLEHELAAHGHRLPAQGEPPGRILADAAALRSVLDGHETSEATR